MLRLIPVLFVLLCALAAVGARAQADDGAAAREPATATIDWGGLYLGAAAGAGVPNSRGERLQAGAGFTSSAFDLYPPGGARTGVSAGAMFGYNWRLNDLVYGVEVDFNLLDGRGGQGGVYLAPASYAPLGVLAYTLNYGAPAKYFASFKGRLGFAVDRALFFASAGVAAGGSRGPATLGFGGAENSLFTAGDSQSSRMKYVIGAGVDYRLDDQWSLRGEYLFLNRSLNTHSFVDDAGRQFYSRTRNEDHVVRLGLNYHFGSKNEYVEEEAARGKSEDAASEQYSVHGQTVNVVQAYPKFKAAYNGGNSLPSKGQGRVSSVTDLFAGLRLWKGAAVYVNPQIDEGFGLANSVGAAAYVNAAAPKIGRGAPYFRFQRYFLRQIVGLGSISEEEDEEGSQSESLESTQNQLSGKVDRNRVTITLGKFSVGDVFDDNVYGHDPTTGFLNFAFNTYGAFDYASDSWGYTHGIAADWKQGRWSTRVGLFQLSAGPNSQVIEPELFRQYMGVGEVERRYKLMGQPGAVKILAYADNGVFANLDDAVAVAAATGAAVPTLDPARKRHVKAGAGVNVKQQIMPGLGFFLRASASDGRYETVDNTDVTRQLSLGVVAAGELWNRKDDEIGVAGAVSGLSNAYARYLSLGGLGVYVGGRPLTYAAERNLEAYYKTTVSKNLDLTFDYQLLINPAYDAARSGPANVFALRARASF